MSEDAIMETPRFLAANSAYFDLAYRRRRIKNALASILLIGAAALALTPLFSVFWYVASQGWAGLSWSFFRELPKPVGETGGGMANAIAGTLALVAMASVIGIPWGMAVGIYLSEYGRGRMGSVVRFVADTLASVPSILIGLFAYAVVVVPMHRFSALAGSIALGLLMVPIVARSSEEILKLVPTHIREAGLALGLPRWKVTLRIVLRASLSGLATSVILAIARVAGETAPLLFTALGSRFWPSGVDQPIASLPVQIYSYAISPYDEWHRQAWTGALVLVFIVVIANLGARALLGSFGRSRHWLPGGGPARSGKTGKRK